MILPVIKSLLEKQTIAIALSDCSYSRFHAALHQLWLRAMLRSSAAAVTGSGSNATVRQPTTRRRQNCITADIGAHIREQIAGPQENVATKSHVREFMQTGIDIASRSPVMPRSGGKTRSIDPV